MKLLSKKFRVATENFLIKLLSKKFSIARTHFRKKSTRTLFRKKINKKKYQFLGFLWFIFNV